MKLENIGFYTLSDKRAMQTCSSSPFWRAEILLSDICNFKCPYCRGLRNDLKGNLNFMYAVKLIYDLKSEKLKNIRFSGGEPTLYPHLLQLVELCKELNIERIAISTNGSADLKDYITLVNAGINDFSISLDACCGSTGKVMCGGVDIWDKVVTNIRALAKLAYVTVGIVFDENNYFQIQETLDFANSLGVSDIRIIPSAQYNKMIKFDNRLFNYIDKYPILKYRFNNFLHGKLIRGLTQTDNKQCPLVLDDIAIAKKYHFPCIIYLREQGSPIGKITDIKQVRQDRLNWYQTHDCFADKICRENCIDVCVEYNNKYEELGKSN